MLDVSKNILRLAGEEVLFKERGVLAVVIVEKIIIESSLLTVVLRPVPGQGIGLQYKYKFKVSAAFSHLSQYRDQLVGALVGWVIETNTLRVAHIRHLFRHGARDVDIVAAFKRRDKIFDAKTEKIIFQLASLNSELLVRKSTLRQEVNFKGQSWGGAGVVVLTEDEETITQFAHFDGLIVISSQAIQIGDLFRKVGRIIAASSKYDHSTKREFWARLAHVVNAHKRSHHLLKLGEIRRAVIWQAIDFLLDDDLRS